MDKYKGYVLEDFVLDAGFQSWARYPTPEKDKLWETYKAQNPDQADDVRRACLLLDSVYTRLEAHITDEEIGEEISAMVKKIRQGKKHATGRPEYLPPLRLRGKWVGAASVVLLMAFFAWYLSSRYSFRSFEAISGNSQVEVVTKQNRTEQSETFFLEDGTKVVLAPDSELKIPTAFGEDKREVHLVGEAFFKVSRDVKRPFLVYSEKLITRVLGTSFIIKAKKSGTEEVVEVKEGKVSVFKREDFRGNANRESHGILVTSNQKVTLEAGLSHLVKSLSDAPEVIPDKVEAIRIGYVNTPVSKVLEDLKEAYQIDIIFDKDLLTGCPLTATLMDFSLKEKLEIICEAIEAKYEILDGQVVIYGKSCIE